MQRLLSATTLLCALLATTAAHAQAIDIDDLYSTGVNANSAPIGIGTADPHWEVQEDALGWQTPLYEKTNYCGSCGGIWVDHPIGDNTISRPLAHPSHVRAAAPNRKFSWRTTFSLPAEADLSTATITYRVGFDDLSRNATDTSNLSGCNHTVWLNGTAYEMTSTGNNIRTECQATIPAGSAFVAGQNTLEFRIQNLATYYGFRFEKVSATYETLTCGNGALDAGETCDDGNTVDGDGCDATCQVEDGYGCEQPEMVVNGDFEQGDIGFMSVLPADMNPIPANSVCQGATGATPNDLTYHVTTSPYATCECDGGSGLCLAVNGGGGAVWSQTLMGLQPNTTYNVSFKYALVSESNPAYRPELELKVDGASLLMVDDQRSRPVPFSTATAQFTTGANQTTALVELINPNAAVLGNGLAIDTISVTGPSVCEPLCGDGALDMGEQCDDGNMVDGDGCDASCQVEDGYSCTQDNAITDLYSTGVDDMSVPLALGVTDAHWEVQEDALGWQPPLYEKTNYCNSCGGVWLDHPIGDNTMSRPLAHPSHVQAAAPNRKFSWRTTFTIPATADPSTATITYRVGFDDVSRNAADTDNLSGCDHTVWLNGTAYEMTSTGDNIRTECQATIPAGSDFVTGQNTLEFRIQNLPTYYGFRLEKLSATYQGPSVCESLCGDGALDMGEACDDGNALDGDGCDASCQVEDGWSCMGEPSVCEPFCGNGTIDEGEACDDGNMTAGDGCSDMCEVEAGWMCMGEPTVCEAPVTCGDGVIQDMEACDDGNTTSGDGCSGACQVEDGYGCEQQQMVVNGDFEDGDTGFMSVLPADMNPAPVDTYCAGATGLSPNDLTYHVTTSPYATCECDGGSGQCLAVNGGGGAVWSQTLMGLQPNTTYNVSLKYALKSESNPAYRPELELKVDGASLATASNQEPRPVPFSTMTAQFSTGANQTTALLELINPNDAILGNDMAIDTISVMGPSTCESACGDGALDMGEQCDDGNTDDGDGCDATCAIEDGWDCSGEPSTCMMQTQIACGDGVVQEGEDCDDGNTADGDGCNASCEVEDCWACEEGDPSVCKETCTGENNNTGNNTTANNNAGNNNAGNNATANNNAGNNSSNNGNEDPGGDDPSDGDSDDNTEEDGCSSTGTGSAPSSAAWLLGLLGLLMARRRKRRA